VNDTEEHLQAIAEMAAQNPELEGVELMPYHDLGRSKSVRLGREPQQTWERAEDEHKQEWLDRLAELGCERATVS
jgi:pyruvate-formate lyase-activating enzyme